MPSLFGRIFKQDGRYWLEHRLDGAASEFEPAGSCAEAHGLLLARAREAAAEPVLTDVAVENDWRPIETAPHDGTAVLLLDGDMFIGYFDQGTERQPPGWREQQEGMRAYPTPTLWMPLPARPLGRASRGARQTDGGTRRAAVPR